MREACEAAIEQLRAQTGGEVVEVELPDLDAASLATVLIANTESLGESSPERLNDLDPEISPINRGFLKYRMLLPAAASVKSYRIRTLMRRRIADLFERGRRARLAHGAGGRPAAGGAPGRAALGNADGRPGQRARRRPRQPDRNPRDQRPGRPRRRRAADRPAAAGGVGAGRAAARRRRGAGAGQRPALGRFAAAACPGRASGGLSDAGDRGGGAGARLRRGAGRPGHRPRGR